MLRPNAALQVPQNSSRNTVSVGNLFKSFKEMHCVPYQMMHDSSTCCGSSVAISTWAFQNVLSDHKHFSTVKYVLIPVMSRWCTSGAGFDALSCVAVMSVRFLW